MSLTPAKSPSLADKLRAQEADAKSDQAAPVEIKAIKKARGRAKKET